MSRAKRWAFGVLALAAVACSVSCATYTPVTGVPWERGELPVGEKIRVTTTDGKQISFFLNEIGEDVLVGRHVRVAFSDIARVERVDPTTWKNIVLGLGGFVGLLTIMIWASGGVG